jgi:hypothetical protein
MIEGLDGRPMTGAAKVAPVAEMTAAYDPIFHG